MSFVHLLLAEIARLRFRARTVQGLLLMLALGLVSPAMWMSVATPHSAAELEAAAAEYELERQSCTNCTVEMFLRDYWDFAAVVQLGIAPTMVIFAALVCLMVIVYVGGDFSSGAITTQLTFTPDRVKLLLARTLVSGLLGLTLLGAAAVGSSGVTIVSYVALNGYGSLPADSRLLSVILTTLFVGFLAGVVGALLVFGFHSARAAGALVAGVLTGNLVFEAIAYDAGSAPHWAYHVLPYRHAESLLVGAAGEGFNQYPLQSTELVSRPESAGYFVALALLVGIVCTVAFHRRDIKN